MGVRLRALKNVEVTRRRFERNVHGDRINDEPDFMLGSFGWNPRRTLERTDMREAVTTEGTLYGDPRPDVLASDVLLIEGELDRSGLLAEWRVMGDVLNWDSAVSGHEVGCEIEVQRTTTY